MRYILENELAFENCLKTWIVNRVADPAAEAEILSTLAAHGQPFRRIAFDRSAFLKQPIDRFPVKNIGRLPFEKIQRALLHTYRKRVQYLAPINSVRNLAIREARREGVDWILPLDGSCFIEPAAWEALRSQAGSLSPVHYMVLPMVRIGHPALAMPNRRPTFNEEPQLVFRRDARQRFNRNYRYGRRDKVELLMRLGVKGPWNRWRDDPWDLPLPKTVAGREVVQQAGWVLRFNADIEAADPPPELSADRDLARQVGLLRLLSSLDQASQQRKDDGQREWLAFMANRG
jgi:hypothetical protein